MKLAKILENESFRIFIRSVVSKAGLTFLFVMVAISIYVVATMPLDFGIRVWSNPKLWADNPKNAPPIWVNYFSNPKLMEHVRIVISKPARVESVEGGGKIFTYVVTYRHGYEQFPQTIIIRFQNVTYYTRYTPVIEVSVRRPDRLVIERLFVWRALTTAGKPPYVRSERIDIEGYKEAAPQLSTFLLREFNITITPERILSREVPATEIIMGKPTVKDENLQFKPLKGRYVFTFKVRTYSDKDYVGSIVMVFVGRAYGLMGTDNLGRDLALGLIYGFPVALLIGVVTSVMTTAIGALAGIVSGYYGGFIDEAIQRVCDVLNNIPLLPLLILMTFIVKNPASKIKISPLAVIVMVLIAFGWAGLAIVIRSMVLPIKSQPFIEAAIAAGASKVRVMFKHIFPQVAPFIFAQMIFFTPSAILSEAAISFLGLGDPSIPTWGQILEASYRAQALQNGFWWWVIPPGLLIMYAAITFVFIAQGLEPIVEPRLRTR